MCVSVSVCERLEIKIQLDFKIDFSRDKIVISTGRVLNHDNIDRSFDSYLAKSRTGFYGTRF